MACFLVPAAEAIVTTVASKAMKKNSVPASEAEAKITFGSKLNWLNNLLWGGSALLAFWVGMVLVAKAIEKRPAPEPEAAEVQS